jgi:hypothetical protein
MPVGLSSIGAAVLTLAAGLLTPAASAGGHFATVVEAHFSRWDRNHDGRLSAQEVTALVTDPAVRGDEAAAVAVIHLYQRGRKGSAACTRDELLHPTAPGPEERRDVTPRRVNFEARFNTFRERIHKTPRVVFAANAPTLDRLSQGYQGDCYFLAAVGAAVHRNAAAVRHMIHPRPDGSCDVVFGNGQSAHVRPLTDAEVALASSAGSQGLWPAVLEEGFGQLKARSSLGGHGTGEGLDAVTGGGDAGRAITLLTGHKARFLAIRKGWASDSPPPQRDAPALAARVRAVLHDAAAQHLLVCCGTSRGPRPPGIASEHDYAVLAYDAGTDTVQLWNPWGNHFEPRGRPGLENGYPTVGGRFQLPLWDFVHIFGGVFYEAPARRRGP